MVVTLVSGLIPAAHGVEQARGYIYDGTVGPNNLAIVIDVAKGWVDMQRKVRARIGSMDSDFGVSYEDCGNEAFYCMTSGLEIVIPKAMPMKQWKYHGLSCQSVAQPGGDAYRITCRSPKYRGHPTYTYSLSRGVVSIESAPIWSGDRFELRSERGLFSPGNNP
ncbi:hypothetical protein B0E48_00315 [Rhodanobacter sp. C03]|nr:hypothetical protein B0E48_00315 [Rhodanobacter sp. C03]